MTDWNAIPEPLRSRFQAVHAKPSFGIMLDRQRQAAAQSGDALAFWRKEQADVRHCLNGLDYGFVWSGMAHAAAYAADWMPVLEELTEREWMGFGTLVVYMDFIEDALASLLAQNTAEVAKAAARNAAEQERLRAGNRVLKDSLDLVLLYQFMWNNLVRNVLYNYEYMALFCFLDNNKLLKDREVKSFCEQITAWYKDCGAEFKPFSDKDLTPYAMLKVYAVDSWHTLDTASNHAAKFEKKKGLMDNVMRIKKLYLELQAKRPAEGFILQ